ncbi:hypothetical protein OGM63_29190 [Plectonema radiosum NIES-515]|uniref:Transposase n=1 Tax=Plectonema radiosum NIES-515 TaxID=2986073 RepID=A0ABT3B825_9CYAN|nr:hypothetical protein [Plectonema radiosum]MCV3217537.1 hypothetical protein [Plectonema radiosum NIES-515]
MKECLWRSNRATQTYFVTTGGFTLPSGALRSLPSAWVLSTLPSERSHSSRKKFTLICPEFVIQLRSFSGTSMAQAIWFLAQVSFTCVFAALQLIP